MLQSLREKTTGWIAAIVLGLLAIPFMFFGVNNYFSTPVETWVAKVGEGEVSTNDYRTRFEQYRQQIRQARGAAYDAREVETPETKRRVLDGMIDEELLRQASEKLGVVIGDAQLRDEILKMEVFQVDGKFSEQQFKLLLATQNMSPVGFQEEMRRDLQRRALAMAISQTTPVGAHAVDQFLRMRDETRDVKFFQVVQGEQEEIAEDDAVLQAYFSEHADRYVSEETVTLAYVELAAASIDVPEAADEALLKQRYDEQSNRFVEPEQRLASHILIRVAADAPAEAQQAAQAKAAELVAQARADGADFAALAREQSEDPGSKAAGGDLGWIEKGFTDPAFEEALFAMDVGTISEPVKSSDGWHVIQMRELRAGSVKPFEDVRGELESEYLATERDRRYNDMAGRLVDTVYRDPSSLDAAAAEIGVEVKRTEPFGRAGGLEALTRNPDVQKFAFSEAAIREQTVSDPIALEGDVTVAVQVAEHQPSRPYTFEEIRDQVVSDWRRDERASRAKAQAEGLLAELQSGKPIDELATANGAELKTFDGLGRSGFVVDPPLLQELFRMQPPAEGASTSAVLEPDAGRVVIAQLGAVHPGDPSKVDAAQREALTTQLSQAAGAAEAQAWVRSLRAGVDIRIAEDRM